MRTSITYEHSLFRRMILPFYSPQDLALLAFLFSGGILLLWVIDISKAPVALLGAYLGAVVLANDSSPAVLRTNSELEPFIKNVLREKGYIQSGRRWSPPVPKYLRWPRDWAELNVSGDDLEVRAPRNVLRLLKGEIETRFGAEKKA